ncbi:hypothetical protein JC777_00290 (plasmid) [Bacillus cytotoxicus]|uniref:YopX protein domain-containing protein n=1 Tax=Bacillus cytotoxicus TaxID=580165 RepID=A0AAX2CP55_9BACI|nr:YopX family protein [Bacillus cytotoxicus]QTR81160.1 hypothetical protein JC777_00290 [Bacillus cytotoxicus]QTR87933.1 hypothetical protein JC774_05275 [Bacillus cytotoxicus]SCM08720.1 Uncharacterized protein BCB44BAC_04664 [Bacillus cytotoxicus]
MREIKFRVWDKESKYFLEGDIIRDCIIGKFIDNPEREVMQYTCLKDKNGKEIYEGDIVKVSGHPFVVDGKYKVYYNEHMELSCGSYHMFRMKNWAEVIGNIYENPELLKN